MLTYLELAGNNVNRVYSKANTRLIRAIKVR